MKLRSQILIILFLFGFTPLLVALAINLPLVMGGLELFYHKAYLQNLRADFRDLDQHLASRIETVRLLAKLPEPGIILNTSADGNTAELETLRGRYSNWVNQLLHDQPDVIEILFFKSDGQGQFMLKRNTKTLELVPESSPKALPDIQQMPSILRLEPGGVRTSPISISPESDGSELARHMTLRIISPSYPPFTPNDAQDTIPSPLGAVGIIIDIGGLARVYHDTYWVQNDGNYLTRSSLNQASGSAFEDFPGLEKLFSNNKLFLWEGVSGEQAIWVPLFVTERSGPLWVGRTVDPSPISYVKKELVIRVALVVAPLILTILLFARWFAVRSERFGQDLLTGLKTVLNRSETVTFTWRGPQELQALGQQLTQLAKTHAENSTALHTHAQQLEKSNRYKSKFLANVSHELRTPLNSILLLSKLLANTDDTALPATYTNQAGIIHEAGKDLMSLIDNILDLSRIEAGKYSFTMENTDLPGLLTGLQELFQTQFDAKGLYLRLKINEQAPQTIFTDNDKLGQIIKNFLSNAIKFTDHGGVTLRLDNNTGGTRGNYPVKISTKDTGIGIPKEKQALVFEAFEQADGSTSRRYGGTGLGLSISRELARLLGGTIELESEEGQGSTFSLLLPMEFEPSRVGPEQILSDSQSNPDLPEPRLPEADFHGKKILIVDDDLHNLLALTPVLERWGLDITAAGDGPEALEILDETEQFDLVLMDIMLPGMDGFETIRRIRHHSALQTLPIICLSAKESAENRRRCLEDGANEVLSKPVEPNLLVNILSRYLTPSKAGQTLDASP